MICEIELTHSQPCIIIIINHHINDSNIEKCTWCKSIYVWLEINGFRKTTKRSFNSWKECLDLSVVEIPLSEIWT